MRRFSGYRFLFGVTVILSSSLVPAAAAESSSDRLPIALELARAEGIPDLDTARLEQHLVVSLLDDHCGFRIVDPEEPAELRLVLRIFRWWDSEGPGGASHFDYEKGRDVRGTEYDLEIGFELRLERADAEPEEPPLATRERTIRNRAATRANPLWDPRAHNERRSFDSITRDARKLVCKQLRRMKREKR
jgi:hypothetical protein